MGFSRVETQPKADVQVTVNCSPHSTVGLLVIDKRIRTLDLRNNEMTQADVRGLVFNNLNVRVFFTSTYLLNATDTLWNLDCE